MIDDIDDIETIEDLKKFIYEVLQDLLDTSPCDPYSDEPCCKIGHVSDLLEKIERKEECEARREAIIEQEEEEWEKAVPYLEQMHKGQTVSYYDAPTDKVFEEVKQKAIEIWQTHDDEFGYATEKVNKIKDLGNAGDNVMYIVAMFDMPNQMRLAAKLSKEARTAIRERMKAGGTPSVYIVF